MDRLRRAQAGVGPQAAADPRQQLALGEQPWAFLILGALGAAGIRYVHSNLFIWWGAPVWGAVVAGSVLIALITFPRAARSNPEG